MKQSQDKQQDTSTGKVEDLIRQIGDEALRKALKKHKRTLKQQEELERLAELTEKAVDQRLNPKLQQPTVPANKSSPAAAQSGSAIPTGDMEEQPEHIKELARRLFAAAISCWTPGMSLRHAYDEFVKKQEGEIGFYWIELAKQVTAHHRGQQI